MAPRVLSSKLVQERIDNVDCVIRVCRVLDPQHRLDNGGVGEISYQIYVKPDGTLFELPMDDADPDPGNEATSLVGRRSSGRRKPVDTYLAKGFRYATQKDIDAALAKTKANEAAAAERIARRDPVYVERERAKIQAEEMAKVIAAANKHQGGNRG